jgi:hypothetical protein
VYDWIDNLTRRSNNSTTTVARTSQTEKTKQRKNKMQKLESCNSFLLVSVCVALLSLSLQAHAAIHTCTTNITTTLTTNNTSIIKTTITTIVTPSTKTTTTTTITTNRSTNKSTTTTTTTTKPLTKGKDAEQGVAGQIQNAPLVNAVWAYDWGAGMPSMPSGVEYVPMWWSYYGASQASDNTAAASLASAGALNLLSFNEPDNSSQANLTTAYALQGYAEEAAACSAAGLGSISPACANDEDSWMQSFMSSASSQGLYMSAVAVHAYQSTASSFLSYVDSVYNMYGVPLWITEFAPTDWASPTTIGVDDCVAFINTAIPGLNSRSYVARYSWYCGTMPGNGVLGTAALFNSDNTLTEVGNCYKQVAGSTTPGPAFTPAGYTWRLQNRADQECLDNYGYTTSGSGVYQYAAGSSPNQRWTIAAYGSYYTLKCVTGGLYLSTLGNTTDGSKVGQVSSISNTELWNITSVGSGCFTITSVACGLCLDTGGQTGNGAQMQLWGNGGSWNQQWMLIGY